MGNNQASAIWRLCAVVMLGLGLAPSGARAQQGEFYAGKTVTIIVGLNAGGTVDTMARTFASYLTRHTPGHPVFIINNMPGAGGLVATNFIGERAAKDGLSLNFQNLDPLAQALGNQGLRVRYDQLEFIGGIGDTRTNYARTDAAPGGIKTPADIMKAQGIAVGAYNNTDISGLLAKLTLDVLGVKHKFITGYRGGQDIFLAIQRGEVQMQNTSISSLRTRSAAFLKSGEGIALNYLVTIDKQGNYQRNKHITEMPAYPDLYREIHGKLPSGPEWNALNWLIQQFGDLAFAMFAPPGTPPAALAALRKGYDAAMADPGLIEHAVKTTGLPYDPVSAEKGTAVLASLSTVSPAILATVRGSIDALGK